MVKGRVIEYSKREGIAVDLNLQSLTNQREQKWCSESVLSWVIKLWETVGESKVRFQKIP